MKNTKTSVANALGNAFNKKRIFILLLTIFSIQIYGQSDSITFGNKKYAIPEKSIEIVLKTEGGMYDGAVEFYIDIDSANKKLIVFQVTKNLYTEVIELKKYIIDLKKVLIDSEDNILQKTEFNYNKSSVYHSFGIFSTKTNGIECITYNENGKLTDAKIEKNEILINIGFIDYVSALNCLKKLTIINQQK